MCDTCLTDVIFLSWRPKLNFSRHVQPDQLLILLSNVVLLCLPENKDLTLPCYLFGLVYKLDLEVTCQILCWTTGNGFLSCDSYDFLPYFQFSFPCLKGLDRSFAHLKCYPQGHQTLPFLRSSDAFQTLKETAESRWWGWTSNWAGNGKVS